MAAQTVFVQGPGGAVIEMDLPLHEAIAEQVEKGYARIVNSDGSQIVEGDRPTEAPGLVDTRPALSAAKGTWVSWAVFNGAAPDEAEAATKNDLIEKYGQIEPGTGVHVAEEPIGASVPEVDPAAAVTPAGVPADQPVE